MDRSLLESVLRRVGPLRVDARLDDAELLRRFAADRDEVAFAALVRRHGSLVWAVCRHLLPHEADAEDAFQATFLTLVRGAKTVRTPAALAAWLHRVAYRVALQAKRSAARRRRREKTVAAAEAADSLSETAWSQLRAAVHEEVGRLPEPLRTAFVLCELEGVGQPEAASALGWKLGTLSGRLAKARNLLLARLARRGIPSGMAVVVGAITASAPPAATARAAALARSGVDLVWGISPTVLELARKATEVSMTRTKLITAVVTLAAVLAAGTATVLLPSAIAQREARQPTWGPSPDSGAAEPAQSPQDRTPYGSSSSGAAATASTAPATTQWEYKFVPKRSESFEGFQRLLTEQGAIGWEYCGVESFPVSDPKQRTERGSSPTIVFKRPKARAASGAGNYGPQPNTGETKSMSDSAPRLKGPGPQSVIPASNKFIDPARESKPQQPGISRPRQNIPTDPRELQPDVTVIRLAKADAVQLAKQLNELFVDRNCRIVAEPQTNSLMVQGDAKIVQTLKTVVEMVDVPPTRSSKPETQRRN